MQKLSYENFKGSTAIICQTGSKTVARLWFLLSHNYRRFSDAVYQFFTQQLPRAFHSFRGNLGPSWEKVKEFAELFWVYLKYQVGSLVEFLKVIVCYYGNFSFMRADLLLLSRYLFKSPFRISKRFMQEKGEQEIYVYGETPLTTLEEIANQCRITAQDRVIDLGCGRGRVCFWLAAYRNCRKVVGIECIPEFVKTAAAVQQQCGVNNLEFLNQDFQTADLSGATVIYLYGICMEDEAIRSLAAHLGSIPSGTKIITVSFPLSDYSAKGVFEIMNRFPAQFSWGTADVYLQIRK